MRERKLFVVQRWSMDRTFEPDVVLIAATLEQAQAWPEQWDGDTVIWQYGHMLNEWRSSNWYCRKEEEGYHENAYCIKQLIFHDPVEARVDENQWAADSYADLRQHVGDFRAYLTKVGTNRREMVDNALEHDNATKHLYWTARREELAFLAAQFDLIVHENRD